MWALYPGLRFTRSNGITLCRICHLRIRGKEQVYADAFERLVRPKDDTVRIGMIMMRHDA
jgi:hypothetical protein